MVGNPVDGPPLCTLTTTNGNSAIIANPNPSAFRASPGPDVVVMAKLPVKLAPIAEQIPAISSSA